jgi:hypothetical protein
LLRHRSRPAILNPTPHPATNKGKQTPRIPE